MKFIKLHIENFLTISSAELFLNAKGLQLIQGVNDDDSSASSNGAGKSSIVDAICWTLYGITAREVKGDAVVSLAAKKNCLVSLDIECSGNTYRFTRHRKHSVWKNSLLAEIVHSSEHCTDISKGTDAETQNLLEQIIGCSYDVFKAAVYCGQEAMPDLPKMKDRELKVLIEEAAGLQRIESAYLAARERHLAGSTALAKATQQRDSFEEQVSEIESSIDENERKLEEWEAGKASRIRTKEEILIAAQESENSLAEQLRTLEVSTAHAKKRLESIDESLESHKRLEREAVAAEQLERQAERAIDAEGLKRLVANAAQIEAQIANPEAEIKKPCPECGTILESMSVEDYVAHKSEHLKTAKERLKEAKLKAQEQLKHFKACKEKAAQLRAKVPDVSLLSNEAREFGAIVSVFEQKSKELARAKQNTAMAQMSLDNVTCEKNPYKELLVEGNKKLEEKQAKYLAAKEELEKRLLDSKVTEATIKVFGSSGVRAQILDTVTPFLNERTADYLSALSDGEIQATWTTLTRTASGDYREKFGIEVYHAKGGDSFSALSGGEKRKVRLATALALQDLVASRATHPINLFIGDELDDALDPAGLERLMSVLERKARERGTVIIISHSDLKDWCDNVTVVRKTAQWTSTVEGSLCV